MLLVYVCELNRRAYAERTRCRLFEAHNHTEECSLARTVRAYDTHDTGWWQRELEILVQHAVAEGLAYAVSLDDHIAQTWAVGDIYLELLLALLSIGIHHLIVGRESCLRLGVTSRGRHTHPLELALQCLAALTLLLLLHSHTLGLLLKPSRVVALPGYSLATVEFENPSCYVVEEVTVVSNGYDRTLILLQVLLEPVDALGVEVVRRLIEEQYVGLLQE